MEGPHDFHIQVGSGEEIKQILSPTTWKYMKKGYFFTRWFAFHPYTWDEGRGMPKVDTGPFRSFLWYLHFLSAVLFYCTLLYRCAQVTVLDPGRRVEQMYVLFLTSFYSIFVLLQIHAVFRRYEIVNSMQGFFLLTRKCEGN